MALEEIEIEGHVGQDPVKVVNEDTIKFPVAVNQSKQDKTSGQWISHTNWYEIVCWKQKMSSFLLPKLKKGDKVVLKGRPSFKVFLTKDNLPKGLVTIDLEKIVIMTKKEITELTDNDNYITSHDLPF